MWQAHEEDESVEDPVEECSDDEASAPPPAAALDPQTPPASRFASLLGSKWSPASSPNPAPPLGANLSALNGSSPPLAPHDPGGRAVMALGPERPAQQLHAGGDSMALTQELEHIIGPSQSAQPTNLEYRLDEVALGGCPIVAEGIGSGEGSGAAYGGALDCLDADEILQFDTTPAAAGLAQGWPPSPVNLNAEAQDTVPASPEALFGAVHAHDDGTLGIGAAHEPFDFAEDNVMEVPDVQERMQTEHWGRQLKARAAKQVAAVEAELSEGSDFEAAVADAGLETGWQQDLDEPWMSRPPHERELWERVRPRALRREAAQLRAMRLPVANLSRLMKLHPTMSMRSSEAQEVVNYSTVLMMQALVHAAARGKAPGQRIQLEDIRQACLSSRELQFLHPLSGTLDVTALTLRSGDGGADGADQQESGAAASARRSAGLGSAAPVPGPGQRLLSVSAFAPERQTSATERIVPEEEAVDSEGEFTPARQEGRGAKRKAPASAQKSTNKTQVARRGGGGKKTAAPPAPTGPGLTSFFNRSVAAS